MLGCSFFTIACLIDVCCVTLYMACKPIDATSVIFSRGEGVSTPWGKGIAPLAAPRGEHEDWHDRAVPRFALCTEAVRRVY